MRQDSEIHSLLSEHLHEPGSSFSIGSFGAIAEFHRDVDEPLALDDPDGLTIATVRGALRVELVKGVMPVAYETLSGRAGRWQHGMIFCLARSSALSNLRLSVTELGPDIDAIRPEDRNAVLFDMGLGARNVDFCVRTKDRALLALLRKGSGNSIFAPGNPVMSAIVEESPHRIAISKLGRAEVFQAIDKVKTPEGPHTHVLPKFLKSGRTHSANIPVPSAMLPCLSLHPANPLSDGNDHARDFDGPSFAAFQPLLKRWGSDVYCAEKQRVLEALQRGDAPDSFDPPKSRLGRAALRVALRQKRQTDGENPAVMAWTETFDTPRVRKSDKRQGAS